MLIAIDLAILYVYVYHRLGTNLYYHTKVYLSSKIFPGELFCLNVRFFLTNKLWCDILFIVRSQYYILLVAQRDLHCGVHRTFLIKPTFAVRCTLLLHFDFGSQALTSGQQTIWPPRLLVLTNPNVCWEGCFPNRFQPKILSHTSLTRDTT